MISVGDRLPDAGLLRIGTNGAETVSLAERLAGRKVVVFGVPGAFTPTCDSAHLPSFVRTADRLRAKGVDEIICISVNDAHVMRVWGEVSGAAAAGISLLADADGAFTKAIGLSYSSPAAGMFDRTRRFALLAEDGVIRILHLEEKNGVCEISGGEAMLDAI